MAKLFNFLGSEPAEPDPAAELRPVLADLRNERAALEALLRRAEGSKQDLQQFEAPLAEAQRTVEAINARADQIALQLHQFETVAPRMLEVETQTDLMAKAQRRVEQTLSNAAGDADRIRSQVEQLRDTIELALRLKDDLSGFLALQGPFKELRSRAEEFGAQLRTLQSAFAQIRGQHDEVMRVYTQSASRLEAMSRDSTTAQEAVEAAERKAATLEQRLIEVSQVAESVAHTAHQLEKLNALAGYVTMKIAALEQQREALERVANQAANLSQTMRQMDAELERQQEKARDVAALQTRFEDLESLHAKAVNRANEVLGRQRETEAAAEAARADLAGLRDELRKAAERFELENRGLESVSQRIADLRGALLDFEERFQSLDQSRQSIVELRSDTDNLSARLETLAGGVQQSEERAQNLRSIAGEVTRLDASTRELSQRASRLEESRPAVDAALKDLGELKQSREAVRDALEQIRVTQADMRRFREAQSGTETWLGEVGGAVSALTEKVDALNALRPQVELLSKEVERVTASANAVEARREFLEDIQRRLAELAALGAKLDERTQGLDSRMEAAEKRFVTLALQGDDAERVARVIFGVVRRVEDAERRVAGIGEIVSAAERRSRDIEALSERVRIVGTDLEQRQVALEKASEHLERASKLREDGAAMVQALEDQTQRLTNALAGAEAREDRLETATAELEERSSSLRFVEKRLGQFEEQLARWELSELEVRRALDDLAGRQATVDALRAEITRMFELAERAIDDVRAVAGAREQVGETREILAAALARLADANGLVERLEHRKRQVEQAEKQLARADALLMDIRSSLEGLEGQRAVVDRVVEQAGVLEFQSKQAEAIIARLRDEREMASRLHGAISELRRQGPAKAAG